MSLALFGNIYMVAHTVNLIPVRWGGNLDFLCSEFGSWPLRLRAWWWSGFWYINHFVFSFGILENSQTWQGIPDKMTLHGQRSPDGPQEPGRSQWDWGSHTECKLAMTSWSYLWRTYHSGASYISPSYWPASWDWEGWCRVQDLKQIGGANEGCRRFNTSSTKTLASCASSGVLGKSGWPRGPGCLLFLFVF